MAGKISSRTAPAGPHGEVALAQGERVAMRMWRDEPPTDDKPSTTSPHETVGYVISGRAKLVLADRTIALEPGDSYCVPAHAVHTYHILETFTAIEATAPPAA
ncbi:cupin domain-containing protein [uncultured Methylobacterium sp.]|uniref:cupin domain-containing protein n=1 Tax=uncultured Methylobacterium sp. TaxID=157278 RepID=UPI0035CAB96D